MPKAGLELVALDALLVQTRRLARHPGAARREADADSLASAAGLRSVISERSMPVVVDAGPPVDVTIPRVCCVLSATPGEGACPTCPARDELERVPEVIQMFAEMDDDVFEIFAGRRRSKDGRSSETGSLRRR